MPYSSCTTPHSGRMGSTVDGLQQINRSRSVRLSDAWGVSHVGCIPSDAASPARVQVVPYARLAWKALSDCFDHNTAEAARCSERQAAVARCYRGLSSKNSLRFCRGASYSGVVAANAYVVV